MHVRSIFCSGGWFSNPGCLENAFAKRCKMADSWWDGRALEQGFQGPDFWHLSFPASFDAGCGFLSPTLPYDVLQMITRFMTDPIRILAKHDELMHSLGGYQAILRHRRARRLEAWHTLRLLRYPDDYSGCYLLQRVSQGRYFAGIFVCSILTFQLRLNGLARRGVAPTLLSHLWWAMSFWFWVQSHVSFPRQHGDMVHEEHGAIMQEFHSGYGCLGASHQRTTSVSSHQLWYSLVSVCNIMILTLR